MMSKVKEALGGSKPEARSHLRITIISVRDLGGPKDASRADPYLSLKVGHQKKKTTVKKNAGDSTDINETFEFDVHPDDSLELTAYDRDMLKDDFLGRTTILVHDLLRERGRQEIKLQPKKDHQAIAGWVTLEATGDGFQDFKDVKDGKAGIAVGGHPRHEEHAHVRITILKVRELGGSKASSKADPYFILRIGDRHKQKTSVKKNAGGNVEFNESFEFDVHPIDALELTAYDSDLLKDGFLGRTSIQLKDLVCKEGPQDLQLQHKDTKLLAGWVTLEASGRGFEDCKDCDAGQRIGERTPHVEPTQGQRGGEWDQQRRDGEWGHRREQGGEWGDRRDQRGGEWGDQRRDFDSGIQGQQRDIGSGGIAGGIAAGAAGAGAGGLGAPGRDLGDRDRDFGDRDRSLGDRDRNFGDRVQGIQGQQRDIGSGGIAGGIAGAGAAGAGSGGLGAAGRDFGDRDRSLGDRDRNFGDRDRSLGDRDRNFGDRDRSLGDKGFGDRGFGDRGVGDQGLGDKSLGDRGLGQDRSGDWNPRQSGYAAKSGVEGGDLGSHHYGSGADAASKSAFSGASDASGFSGSSGLTGSSGSGATGFSGSSGSSGFNGSSGFSGASGSSGFSGSSGSSGFSGSSGSSGFSGASGASGISGASGVGGGDLDKRQFGGDGSGFKRDIDQHDIGGARTLEDQPARTGGIGRQREIGVGGVGDSVSRDHAGFR